MARDQGGSFREIEVSIVTGAEGGGGLVVDVHCAVRSRDADVCGVFAKDSSRVVTFRSA